MTTRETLANIIRVYKNPPIPEYQLAHLEDILRNHVKSEITKVLFNLSAISSLPFTKEEKEFIIKQDFKKLKKSIKKRNVQQETNRS